MIIYLFQSVVGHISLGPLPIYQNLGYGLGGASAASSAASAAAAKNAAAAAAAAASAAAARGGAASSASSSAAASSAARAAAAAAASAAASRGGAVGSSSAAAAAAAAAAAGSAGISSIYDYDIVSSGPLLVTSSSPLYPGGLYVSSENSLDGTVLVTGTLPFLSAVGFEGTLPTAGSGAATCGCGTGHVGILNEV
jgi:hypothetical protein